MSGEIFEDNRSLPVHPVTCWHLSIILHKIGIYSIHSSNIVGHFHDVLDFNQLILKLNQFICDYIVFFMSI